MVKRRTQFSPKDKKPFFERLSTAIGNGFAAVAPTIALRRQESQFRRELIGSLDFDHVKALVGGYYRKARKGRTLGEWKTDEGDANASLTGNLVDLRNDSNDLYTNNAIANGAVNTPVTNVVGTGLELHSTIDADFLNMTEEEAEKWETAAEREFEMFGATCDTTLGNKFSRLTDLVYRSCLINGDLLVNLPFRNRKESHGIIYETAVNLIEGHRISNPDRKKDSPTMMMGVEIDKDGAPLYYHVSKEHPGAVSSGKKMEWTRLKAFGSDGRRNVLHVYHKKRINQLRGIPFLAPIIESIKKLDTFTQAEIDAAVVQSFFTVFITKASVGDGNVLDVVKNLSDELGSKTSDKDLKMASANIINLAQDEKVEFGDPKAPHASYDNFVKAIVRQIGMALEIPAEVLMKSFESSYSASRGAIIEAWKFFNAEREWLSAEFCQPVYEAMLFEAVATGRLSAPGYLTDPLARAAYSRAEWVGPEQGELDPVKAAEASTINLKNYTTNHFIESGRRGYKFNKLIQGIKRAKDMIEDLDLPFLAEVSNIREDGDKDEDGSTQQPNNGD